MILGWVLFRADSLGHAVRYLSSMFGLGAEATEQLALRPVHLIAATAGAVVIWLLPTTQHLLIRARAAWVVPLQAAFWLSLVQLHHVDHVPFLYFQF